VSPPRPVQLHLSTALLLMLVSGALIWSNLRPVAPADMDALEQNSAIEYALEQGHLDRCGGYGWPLTARVDLGPSPNQPTETYWLRFNLILDAIIALVALAVTAIVSELLQRRPNRPT
jgi:hypothetical protein